MDAPRERRARWLVPIVVVFGLLGVLLLLLLILGATGEAPFRSLLK